MEIAPPTLDALGRAKKIGAAITESLDQEIGPFRIELAESPDRRIPATWYRLELIGDEPDEIPVIAELVQDVDEVEVQVAESRGGRRRQAGQIAEKNAVLQQQIQHKVLKRLRDDVGDMPLADAVKATLMSAMSCTQANQSMIRAFRLAPVSPDQPRKKVKKLAAIRLMLDQPPPRVGEVPALDEKVPPPLPDLAGEFQDPDAPEADTTPAPDDVPSDWAKGGEL